MVIMNIAFGEYARQVSSVMKNFIVYFRKPFIWFPMECMRGRARVHVGPTAIIEAPALKIVFYA